MTTRIFPPEVKSYASQASFASYTNGVLQNSTSVLERGNAVVRKRQAIGTDRPNFKSELGKHDTTNAFDASDESLRFVPGTLQFKAHAASIPQNWIARQTTLGGFFHPWAAAYTSSLGLNSFDSKVRDAAQQKLIGKIRKCQGDFHSLIFLGELRESVAMIRNPAKALREGYDKLFELSRKRARGIRVGPGKDNFVDILKEMVSSTWLEFVFGWTPLINDVNAGIKSLKRIGETEYSCRLSGTAEQTTDLGSNYTYNQPLAQGWAYCTRETSQEETQKCIFKSALSHKVVTPAELYSTLFRVSWSEVPIALWELTPWSFVWDYFVNIGKILDYTFTNTEDLTYISRTYVTFREKRWHSSVDKASVLAGNPSYVIDDLQSTPEVLTRTRKSVVRRKVTNLTFPSLHLTLPGINSTKWLNLIALYYSGQRNRYSVIG